MNHGKAFLALSIVIASLAAFTITNTILRVDRELVIRLVIDLEPLRKK